MRLSTAQAEIRDAVRGLLATAGVQQPPVDLNRVAFAQGIKDIRSAPLRSAFGTLTRRAGGLTITLNERFPNRARFTLAHEIAHTLVEPIKASDPQVVLARAKPRSANRLERLCDEVAVELLLPYDMFREAVNTEPVTIDQISRLSNLFDASLQSTALRSAELATEPVQVLCWSRHGPFGLKAKAERGERFLTSEGAVGFRSFNSSSAVTRAYATGRLELGAEQPDPHAPWAIYSCEARAFMGGDARFVLSVVKPSVDIRDRDPAIVTVPAGRATAAGLEERDRNLNHIRGRSTATLGPVARS